MKRGLRAHQADAAPQLAPTIVEGHESTSGAAQRGTSGSPRPGQGEESRFERGPRDAQELFPIGSLEPGCLWPLARRAAPHQDEAVRAAER